MQKFLEQTTHATEEKYSLKLYSTKKVNIIHNIRRKLTYRKYIRKLMEMYRKRKERENIIELTKGSFLFFYLR